MTLEEDPLIDLAAAVADGAVVDWQVAQSSAGSDDMIGAVGELRIIAEIARLHRGAPLDEPETSGSRVATPPISSPAAPVRPDPNAPRWGPLLVLEPLGSGAFGDVFRAWDTTLDREVALKLLKQRRRSGGTDSIIREGQLLARVRHPNVMAIHGALALDGQVGIWSEFLHGLTLAQVVAGQGPLSAEETIVFADAICRALAAAHRAGLLHRDVKAQNVMRERGGRIVLMDFGLGRERNGGEAKGGLELAGTPLYLAPELFTASPASVQTDIYSLGVLMFFLVTATFPVTGGTLDEIAAQHAAGRRQRLQDLRPDLPAAFIQIVERALEPDPARRFESAGAMQAALAIASRPAQELATEARGFRLFMRPSVMAALGATALLAAVATVAWTKRAPVAPGRPVMFSIAAPPHSHFTDSSWNTATISPDGQYVALVATDDTTGRTRLWLSSLGSMTATSVPESSDPVCVFWAPDSQALAFFGDEGLKRVSVGGVRSETVTAASEPRGGSWSRNGTILFAQGPRGALFGTPVVGGPDKPSIVLAPDRSRGELGYMWPQFLPDGDRFIYFVSSNDAGVRGIYLSSLSTPTRTRLVASDTSAIVAGESLLFVRDGNLAVQHFNADRKVVDGEAVTLVDHVGVTFDFRSLVTSSDDGTLVYSPAEFTQLTWRARSGSRETVLGLPTGRYRSPALSGDGRYLAVQHYRDTLSEVSVFDLVRGGTTTITRGTPSEPKQTPSAEFPVWGPAPDDRLAFASSDYGWQDIFVRKLGAAELPRLLLRSESDKMPTDWSKDGRFLLYQDLPRGGSYDLWALPVSGEGKPFPIVAGPADEGEGRFSPDVRRIAYVSTASGHAEVWVRGFPDGDAETQVSVGGGLDPAWLSNTDISFLDHAGRLMIASVPTAERTTAAVPSLAFQTLIATPGASRNNYAWDQDRRRVLINEPTGVPSGATVVVITNWRARMPRQ